MNTAPDTHPVRRVPPHIVVAFCGRSGSGKTTLADAAATLLIAEGRHYPVKTSLARPIKAALHPIDKTNPAFRDVAQQVGDLCRGINPDCFVDLLRDRIDGHETPIVALVDDCRRVNEGQIADLVFRLVTTRATRLTPGQAGHVSETEWETIHSHESFLMDEPGAIGPAARRVVNAIYAFAEASEEQ